MALKLQGIRLTRNAKRAPFSFCVKVSIAVIIALSFMAIWSFYSSPPSAAITNRRNSFDDIESQPLQEFPVSKTRNKPSRPHTSTKKHKPPPPPPPPPPAPPTESTKVKEENKKEEEEEEEVKNVVGEEEEKRDEDEEVAGEDQEDPDIEDGVDVNQEEDEDEDKKNRRRKRNPKNLGPVFDPKTRYEWKMCSGKNKQNYVPCTDMEGSVARRHTERSCPRHPLMCLVPLPSGYGAPVTWPESRSKILWSNVAHPKLDAYVKTQKWLNLSGEYLIFRRDEEFKGGVDHYLSSIEEMVPDIEWGKNIRVVLDIGCTDAGFGAALIEKDVITLTLGLMNDQNDLAQIALERGIPSFVGSLGTRRLPFPSSVFDGVHCSDCNVAWHSGGGRLLLEMNRILRPGGYFIISHSHGDIDREEGMSKLTASICWNILAHKTDEVSEMSTKIYQKPTANNIYDLRRRNEPPLCKEDENQDASWYAPIKTCLHKLPAAIEQHGTDWPEEWPKRLETFPEWLGDLQEKLTADDHHWKAIFNRSYLNGMGIDWSNIRNIMDMKAIYGGFAAALASQKVWVMNVVPVHAPNTLPVIYERGLLGIYHDWCEPFGTYPRTYDLLHADHLFSRLKNRCKHPIVIVVEMDRILRPGGWAIIREKLEILNPLEMIFRTLHWDIRMTFAKDKEGIICVQKTTWRPPAT